MIRSGAGQKCIAPYSTAREAVLLEKPVPV
jgi:hypothetical protein